MGNALTVGEAALLYCILGTPNPDFKTGKSKEERLYPSPEQAISYIKGLTDLQNQVIEQQKESTYEQLCFA